MGWFWSCRILQWSGHKFVGFFVRDRFALRERQDCFAPKFSPYIWAALTPDSKGTRIRGTLGYHHHQWFFVFILTVIILAIVLMFFGSLLQYLGLFGPAQSSRSFLGT